MYRTFVPWLGIAVMVLVGANFFRTQDNYALRHRGTINHVKKDVQVDVAVREINKLGVEAIRFPDYLSGFNEREQRWLTNHSLVYAIHEFEKNNPPASPTLVIGDCENERAPKVGEILRANDVTYVGITFAGVMHAEIVSQGWYFGLGPYMDNKSPTAAILPTASTLEKFLQQEDQLSDDDVFVSATHSKPEFIGRLIVDKGNNCRYVMLIAPHEYKLWTLYHEEIFMKGLMIPPPPPPPHRVAHPVYYSTRKKSDQLLKQFCPMPSKGVVVMYRSFEVHELGKLPPDATRVQFEDLTIDLPPMDER